MQQETLIWLFGVIGAWCLVLTGLWFHTKGEISRIRLAVELFVDSMGKAAVTVLHSPDDHLGFDHWCEIYEARHFEMSYHEWGEMKAACGDILNHTKATKLEKAQAKMLAAVCSHKLACRFIAGLKI